MAKRVRVWRLTVHSVSSQLSVRNMMVDSTWASAAASYIDIYNSVADA